MPTFRRSTNCRASIPAATITSLHLTNGTSRRAATAGSILFRAGYVGSRTAHPRDRVLQSLNPTGIAGCAGSVGSRVGGNRLGELHRIYRQWRRLQTNTFSSTVQADITTSTPATTLSRPPSKSACLMVSRSWLTTLTQSLDDLPFGEGVSGFDTGYSTLPFNDPNRHRMDYGPRALTTRMFSPVLMSGTLPTAEAPADSFAICWMTTRSAHRFRGKRPPHHSPSGNGTPSTGIGQDRGTFISVSIPIAQPPAPASLPSASAG